MSFRLKTILGIALIEALALFILILSSMHFLQSSNEEELLKRAYTSAKLFATTTKDAVLATDLALLDHATEEMLTNPGVVYARVTDRKGAVLAQGGNAEALRRPFSADKSFRDVADNVFDAFADITVGGVSYGRVDVGLSTDAIKGVLTEARVKTIIIAIVEMMLVALFSYLLGLYLTRGLYTLEQASIRISRGEMGHKIPIRGKDELARTARSFNEMSEKLALYYNERKRAEDELNKLNEDLENRVKLRTDQLAEAYQKIEHQALHDSLTKLPNRTLFHDRIEQAILTGQRENRPFALVMMDLNGFKEINDTLGHHSGDLVLQEMASRLRAGLRQSDTVARLGGDEFAMLLPTVKDHATAITAADKILDVVDKTMTINDQSLYVTGSLGIALFPKDGGDPSTLLRRADMAMYDAKRSKTGRAIYTPDMDESNVARVNLQSELRHAISAGQLVLYYQPKIDFPTARISGVEALVRWQHPKRGLMFPDDFIPMAEHSDLIKPLTTWVLKTALRQCKTWSDAGLELSISINVSVTNLQDPAFVQIVADALAESQVKPGQLELEITEMGIMVEPPRAIEAITRISELGVQIIIDDFGTGYSSMAYLKKLPIAKIKVDKSFVRDMLENKNDAVIVRSIIGLGHNLGLNVVAEGVENEATWKQLKDLNCDSAQGYCMSRPIPPDEFDKWLQESPYGRPRQAGGKD